LKFKTAGKIMDNFKRESIEYTSNISTENPKNQNMHPDALGNTNLASRPIIPKSLPRHCLERSGKGTGNKPSI
jgi:hypothetical protein